MAQFGGDIVVVLINGASGAGKTFLLKRLGELRGHNFVPVKKCTTRSRRKFEKDSESPDLIYDCDAAQIKSLAYSYFYKGNLYGIDANEIMQILSNHLIPVIIVRSFEIIKEIKSDFEDVRALFVVGPTGKILKQKLLAQGRSLADVRAAQDSIATITGEYVDNIDIIDHCLLNFLYDEEFYIRQFMEYTISADKER